MERLSTITNQASHRYGKPALLSQVRPSNPRLTQPYDIVICCAIRTPITRATKGGMSIIFIWFCWEKSIDWCSLTVAIIIIIINFYTFILKNRYFVAILSWPWPLGLAGALPEDLLKPLFEAIIERTKINVESIQDICIGNVLQPGGGALSSRIAQLLGGLSSSIPLHTVNRQCSSGLQVGGIGTINHTL